VENQVVSDQEGEYNGRAVILRTILIGNVEKLKYEEGV
jgi:hypothetical protein